MASRDQVSCGRLISGIAMYDLIHVNYNHMCDDLIDHRQFEVSYLRRDSYKEVTARHSSKP